VDDKLSALSGGEKARVALCRMLLLPSNLLLLDEPTNHLDIAAKEVLEQAIQNYEGTVVMVSHDRYFVSQTANTILALEPPAEGDDSGGGGRRLVVYDGDYRSYIEQNEETKEKVERRCVEMSISEIQISEIAAYIVSRRGGLVTAATFPPIGTSRGCRRSVRRPSGSRPRRARLRTRRRRGKTSGVRAARAATRTRASRTPSAKPSRATDEFCRRGRALVVSSGSGRRPTGNGLGVS
jgi:hypothetical protein